MGQFLNFFINPDRAANALQQLVTDRYPIAQATHVIGYGLLMLFVLLEIYRMWVAGTERELAVLAAKVAIVGYMIGPSSPLPGIVTTVYGYTAQAGYAIIAGSAGAQLDAIRDAIAQIASAAPGGSWWSLFDLPTLARELLGGLLAVILMLVFLLVLLVVIALFVFSVLASRVFVLISMLLAPIAFTAFLWRPMTSFAAKWISTALHAFFLPLIGAISLVAALELGIVQPIQDWAKCMQQGAQSAQAGALACIGSMSGNFLLAILGGLVAIFLMLSVDKIVGAYLGTVEVTTAGLLAARWAGSKLASAGHTAVSSAVASASGAAGSGVVPFARGSSGDPQVAWDGGGGAAFVPRAPAGLPASAASAASTNGGPAPAASGETTTAGPAPAASGGTTTTSPAPAAVGGTTTTRSVPAAPGGTTTAGPAPAAPRGTTTTVPAPAAGEGATTTPAPAAPEGTTTTGPVSPAT